MCATGAECSNLVSAVGHECGQCRRSRLRARYCLGRPGEWVRLKAPQNRFFAFAAEAPSWVPTLYNRFEPLAEGEVEPDTSLAEDLSSTPLENALVSAGPVSGPGTAKQRFPNPLRHAPLVVVSPCRR